MSGTLADILNPKHFLILKYLKKIDVKCFYDVKLFITGSLAFLLL